MWNKVDVSVLNLKTKLVGKSSNHKIVSSNAD